MKYYIPRHGETAKDARGLPKSLYAMTVGDPKWFAEKAAEYVHWNEDGWEASWPINFIIIDEDIEYLIEVDREMEPVFSSNIIEKRKAKNE